MVRERALRQPTVLADGRFGYMDFLKLPLYAAIEESQNILLAGAGGGFDIFCGLPLYFGLRSGGKQVHLANLSFSDLYYASGTRPAPGLLEVTADSGGSK